MKKVYKPLEDYDKITEATIDAINMVSGVFSVRKIKVAVNDLLEADNITTTHAYTAKNIAEHLETGAIVVVERSGKAKRYERVNQIEHTQKEGVALPDFNSLTPAKVCEWLLNYMQTTVGVSESINDLETTKKDAATMHKLQERCNELVERHNADQREIDKLRVENLSMDNTCKHYEVVAKERDALAAKLNALKAEILK
jgi:hypothetical protein